MLIVKFKILSEENNKQIINIKTSGSPTPVSFIWLCMNSLSSSNFIIFENKLFIHIPMVNQCLVVYVN